MILIFWPSVIDICKEYSFENMLIPFPSFLQAFEALWNGKAIKCLSTGNVYSDLPRPTVAVIDVRYSPWYIINHLQLNFTYIAFPRICHRDRTRNDSSFRTDSYFCMVAYQCWRLSSAIWTKETRCSWTIRSSEYESGYEWNYGRSPETGNCEFFRWIEHTSDKLLLSVQWLDRQTLRDTWGTEYVRLRAYSSGRTGAKCFLMSWRRS
jgi:hypothetical protein